MSGFRVRFSTKIKIRIPEPNNGFRVSLLKYKMICESEESRLRVDLNQYFRNNACLRANASVVAIRTTCTAMSCLCRSIVSWS